MTCAIISVQSPPSIWPNLILFYPDELYSPHPDDSPRSHSTEKKLQAPGWLWLALVYPDTFAEWPHTHHWHQVGICIHLMNTIFPLYCDLENASNNTHTGRGSFSGGPNRQLTGEGRYNGTFGILLTCFRINTSSSHPWYAAWSLLHSQRPRSGHKSWDTL